VIAMAIGHCSFKLFTCLRSSPRCPIGTSHRAIVSVTDVKTRPPRQPHEGVRGMDRRTGGMAHLGALLWPAQSDIHKYCP
jgi:hypothetical protein